MPRKENPQNLAALRLISKAFCDNASIWLFWHIDARSDSSSKNPPLERFMKIPGCSMSIYLKQKTIEPDMACLQLASSGFCFASEVIFD